jgi:DNA-binding Lrp family transcriptional regulator
MSLSSEKRNEVVDFLVANIREHPEDVVKLAHSEFGISNTAILRYLKNLQKNGIIEITGSVQKRKYSLICLRRLTDTVAITPDLAEDKIWREKVMPLLTEQKENVFRICEYGFSEIFNNAIDHSEGTQITYWVEVFADSVVMTISDNGIGIFNKIQQKCHLDDPSHAILELSKGKLTTSPENHTGEGIFFTSRMFDNFTILSDKLRFGSRNAIDLLWEEDEDQTGTFVVMQISTQTNRTTQKVFDEFADVDHGFDKTIVPVELVRYGNENLVSRSQAKRMLARLEKFATVILDFKGVEEIGRAFADEVFRVFQNAHPNISILPMHTTQAIDAVIKQVSPKKEEKAENG